MAYVISGCVAFATKCSSPSSCAYALLLSPLLPSGLGSIFTFGSSGVLTGFAPLRPCLINIDSTLLFCDIIIASSDLVILIPIILEGLPRSVTSHCEHRSFFISFIIWLDPANNNKSSTHMVMMATSSFFLFTYMQGSTWRHINPFWQIFLSNSMFHLWPDCFNPYSIFTSRHTQFVPSSNPSGWHMYTVSFR